MNYGESSTEKNNHLSINLKINKKDQSFNSNLIKSFALGKSKQIILDQKTKNELISQFK